MRKLVFTFVAALLTVNAVADPEDTAPINYIYHSTDGRVVVEQGRVVANQANPDTLVFAIDHRDGSSIADSRDISVPKDLIALHRELGRTGSEVLVRTNGVRGGTYLIQATYAGITVDERTSPPEILYNFEAHTLKRDANGKPILVNGKPTIEDTRITYTLQAIRGVRPNLIAGVSLGVPRYYRNLADTTTFHAQYGAIDTGNGVVPVSEKDAGTESEVVDAAQLQASVDRANKPGRFAPKTQKSEVKVRQVPERGIVYLENEVANRRAMEAAGRKPDALASVGEGRPLAVTLNRGETYEHAEASWKDASFAD